MSDGRDARSHFGEAGRGGFSSRTRIEALYQEIAALVSSVKGQRAEGVVGDACGGAAGSSAPVAFMEVCGTHTMAIGRHGLRFRLPARLRLISGPGCPVCVTDGAEIDRAIAMASVPDVIVATFGDLLRVPGSSTTLAAARAAGARVTLVYSPLEALELAEKTPAKRIVFIGVGFETTSPTIAATVLQAERHGIENFLVLSAFKVVPPAMLALAATGEVHLDGFICPGHVSSIIGSRPYEAVAEQFHLPCVVTGFEAEDLLEGIAMLLRQRVAGEARVEVQYQRAVPVDGNPRALELLDKVFAPCDAIWRGIGLIPGSGLAFRERYARFDAAVRVPVEVPATVGLPPGCSCGRVMRGLMVPPECALFGQACVPAHPVGPCMVSSEGACAAWHRYGGTTETLEGRQP
jgi:hydrogenase expression/formation protein HypD